MCKSYCNICGHENPPRTSFKPRLYCSQNCANYAKFKVGLEKALLAMKPISSSKSVIRGDMFRLANLLSKSTFTLEVDE